MQIQLNGEPREIDDGLNLSKLVAFLNLKPEQIAIELNRRVVRRADWETTPVKDGDQLEIVHFVGGGTSTDYADYAD